MNYFSDVLHLFYPKICVTCSTELLNYEKVVCTQCRHDLPIICYTSFKDNKIKNTFLGRIPIENAGSFLIYRKEGKTKALIQHLKYKGQQEVGDFLGHWFGNILKESGEFNTIDYIVPVPLHKIKLQKRGYNQLTLFGNRLSQVLQSEYISNALIRTSTSKTQTFKQRFERFNNAQTTFHLIDPNLFSNKHVLLIDDVITTGATLEACCKELQRTKNIKISIVTMAYTE